MKRSQRVVVVQRVVDDQERRRAQALAASERQVTESEAKLAELEVYQASYLRDFSARAGTGMNAASARDYQAFLARLGEALKQQGLAVVRAKAHRDSELRNWQGAAQRADAVGHVVKRWNAEEQRELDRTEQKETDEFSQRPSALGLFPRGA
jgi:flagellar protein FliJ